MANILEVKNIRQESRFINERRFNVQLLEIFSGERSGTANERKKLRAIRKKIGEKIYVEAVHLLTNRIIPETREARKVFDEIQGHQMMMTSKLQRRVSLQVAALDYMQYVLNLLNRPIVLEEEKSVRIAQKIISDRKSATRSVSRMYYQLSSKLGSKQEDLVLKRRVLKGIVLAHGLATGRAFHYQDILTRELEMYDLADDQIGAELNRVLEAIQKVDRDLGGLKQEVEKQVGAAHAAIFDVHKLILKDMNLMEEVERDLRRRLVNAEHVVRDIFGRWERRLRASESEMVRDKAEDMADIGRRLLRALMGIQGNVLVKLPYPAIIFAKRLLPSDTVYMDKKKTKGVVIEEGGPNSHAAVLARAMGIPLISSLNLDMNRIPKGALIILDGDRGSVIVHPRKKELTSVVAEISLREKQDLLLAKKGSKKKLLFKGQQITVKANVASAEEVRIAQKYGCDGIGLYRIESIYMSSRSLPDEEYLHRILSAALEPVRKKEITLRFLDVGGDKTLPYFNLSERGDSVLGLRSVRLLLRHPVLLETQIRVFLRLSREFKIKMLIPMVSLPQDVKAVREVLEKEKEKFRKAGEAFDESISLGSMIETPSAVLALDDILKISDFLSIGTNDLLQYTMAADREKVSVSKYYEAGNRLILEWIRIIAEKSKEANKECTICGELAGDFRFTDMLFENGVKSYSVIPHLIPRLKQGILNLITTRQKV